MHALHVGSSHYSFASLKKHRGRAAIFALRLSSLSIMILVMEASQAPPFLNIIGLSMFSMAHFFLMYLQHSARCFYPQLSSLEKGEREIAMELEESKDNV